MVEITPALFIGHGSPMNMFQDNEFTRDLKDLGTKLKKPRAVAVISAHWMTENILVTAEKNPKMIYDYYGFPKEFYNFRYSPPGSPEIATMIAENLPQKSKSLSYDWGLDHACFSILKHIYPSEDVPVIEISIDLSKSPRFHYEIGQKFNPLREKGVMFIGSGNMMHSFKFIDYEQFREPYTWAKEFDEILEHAMVSRNHESLINFKQWELSRKAFQSYDHYLPMLYILGMQRENEELQFIHNSIQHGSVSHRCFKIG